MLAACVSRQAKEIQELFDSLDREGQGYLRFEVSLNQHKHMFPISRTEHTPGSTRKSCTQPKPEYPQANAHTSQTLSPQVRCC